jgi:hypothetical protein
LRFLLLALCLLLTGNFLLACYLPLALLFSLLLITLLAQHCLPLLFLLCRLSSRRLFLCCMLLSCLFLSRLFLALILLPDLLFTLTLLVSLLLLNLLITRLRVLFNQQGLYRRRSDNFEHFRFGSPHD